MNESKTYNLKVDPIVSKAVISDVKIRQKSGFSIQHLMAAARFSRQCGDVQNRNRDKALGSFYDEQISCVSAAIMLCVASLEANINEHLSEAEILFPEFNIDAQQSICSLINKLSIIEKYQKVLSIKGIDIFDRGEQPLQDIEVLISLRNEFVHFQPEWHDEQERHKKLGLKLRGKFELSPFISESTGVLFPQRIVSHGCTKWALETSIKFIEIFCLKIDQKCRLDNYIGELRG